MSDAEKIARGVIGTSKAFSRDGERVLVMSAVAEEIFVTHVAQALLAAEARGYAAAREQAAALAETMSENWECAPSVQAVAEAIRKMEPNT